MDTFGHIELGNFASTTTPHENEGRQSTTAGTMHSPQLGGFNNPIQPPDRVQIHDGDNDLRSIGEDTIRESSVRGWPSAAALQSASYNHSHHRVYAGPLHRALLDQQTKISFLAKELEKRDIEDDSDPDRRWRLEGTVFDLDSLLNSPYDRGWQNPCERSEHPGVTRRPGETQSSNETCHCGHVHRKQDEKDQILEALFSRLTRYSSALVLLNQVSRLPQTSPTERQNMINTLRKKASMNGDAWQFLNARNDFVSTRGDRTHQPFESLIHDHGPISSIFKWAMKDRARPQDENDPSLYLNTDHMLAFARVLVGMSCGIFLVAPIVLLLLAPLSDVVSLAVVCGFGTLFMIVMISRGMTMDTVLIAASAYMAVLVAFLVNQPHN